MAPLTVDLRGINLDLLHPTDNAALAGAVREAINPTQPIVESAGFDNKVHHGHRTPS